MSLEAPALAVRFFTSVLPGKPLGNGSAANGNLLQDSMDGGACWAAIHKELDTTESVCTCVHAHMYTHTHALYILKKRKRIKPECEISV